MLKKIDELAKKYSSKTICLRLAQERDAEFIFEMMQNKEYQKYYMERLIPKSIEAEKKEIKSFLKNAEKGKGYYFLIEYKGKPVGIMDVYKGHSMDMRAAIGYGLLYEYWNKGIMSKAIKILLNLVQKEFGFHAVEATTYPKNYASRKILEKAGFKKVGIMEKYTWSRGKWEDRVLYWKVIQ
jgi:[ribosomal protein S5]-alanine N-acetyltransferase